ITPEKSTGTEIVGAGAGLAVSRLVVSGAGCCPTRAICSARAMPRTSDVVLIYCPNLRRLSLVTPGDGIFALQALPALSRIVTSNVTFLSRLACCHVVGKQDSDGRSTADGALRRNGTAVCFDEVSHDGEPQSSTSRLPGSPAVRSIEPFEDPRQMFGRNAAAGVLHHKRSCAALPARFDRDPAAAAGVAQRVLHEVDEDLLERRPIGVN